MLEKYEKKISNLEKKITVLSDQIDKLKQFVASRNLGEAFKEFVKSMGAKTLKKKLEEQKNKVAEQNRQHRVVRGETDRKKRLEQEM